MAEACRTACFPLEVFEAVRAAFPADRPVTMRVSGTDWVNGGWEIDQTVTFAQALEARGCSAIHVSSGGLTPSQQIPIAYDSVDPFPEFLALQIEQAFRQSRVIGGAQHIVKREERQSLRIHHMGKT